MKTIHRIALAGAAAMGAVVFVAAPANASGNGHGNGNGQSWHGKRVHVVLPGQSIQDAVDSAHSGDTIVLKAGDYDGGILISKSNLTIRGAGASTVLRDTGTNHCLTVAGPTGICVTDPTHTSTVKRVTIKNLTVRDFAAFGVFGLGTDRLSVFGVHAADNAEYGITEFDSTRGAFVGNLVTGTAEEAGLYVGDIADARGTIVKNNIAVDNALGVLVRHARNVNVTNNTLVANCAGIALVDDGQAGGQGNTRVVNNVIDGNNKSCPPSGEVPPLQGSGVIMFGGDHNTIRGNQIVGNIGTEQVSGGVFLGPGANHNSIVKNVIRGNDPADIVNVSGNSTNVFKHNECDTSQPGGLC